MALNSAIIYQTIYTRLPMPDSTEFLKKIEFLTKVLPSYWCGRRFLCPLKEAEVLKSLKHEPRLTIQTQRHPLRGVNIPVPDCHNISLPCFNVAFRKHFVKAQRGKFAIWSEWSRV